MKHFEQRCWGGILVRLTKFLLILALVVQGITSFAMGQFVSIKLYQATIGQVIDQIEENSDYRFFFNSGSINTNQKMCVNSSEVEINDLLKDIFEDTDIDYLVSDMQIVLFPKNKEGDQEKSFTVKGRVVDAKGVGLPGVNVIIKGKNTGTTTNIDGVFSIVCTNPNDVLQFSCIGMETKEIPVAGKANLKVVLTEKTEGLDEVVIVGYGKQTRSKLTSSIATVDSEGLKQASVPNLENALGGRMSGVFARQTSGEPGYDGANIRIRGFGNALIVVDGIPGRNYSNLTANEIESISVLKDAASAAIYGMQGANGVILVTTKKGATKDPVVEFNSTYGVQRPTRFPKPMGSDDWQKMQNYFRANNQLKGDPSAVISEDDLKTDPNLPNTNWYKKAVRDYAPTWQASLNVSGGNENVKYYLLGGYLNQEGIWKSKSTEKDRYNIRSNIDIKVNDNLNIQGGIGGVFTYLKFPGAGQHAIGQNIITTPPIFDPKNEGGYAYVPVKDGYNPLALMSRDYSGYTKDRSRKWNINLSGIYKVPFVEGLSLKGVLGYDTNDNLKKSWNKALVTYKKTNEGYEPIISKDGYTKTRYGLDDSSGSKLTLQGYIDYAKSITNHNMNFSLVYEETRERYHGFTTGRGTYPSNIVDNINAGMDDDKKWNSDWERTHKTRSYIGRFAYDFDTKYMLEFVGRYDGAQYFAKKKRWGFFPAVSAGWMISKESFMKSLQHIVTELKVRASWGQLGDMSAAKNYYSEYKDYYWKEGYKYPGDVLKLGSDKIYTLKERLNANPKFTWAKSTTYNLGVDGKLWGDQLGFIVEAFYRKRKDLPAKKADDNSGNLATYYNLNGDNTRGFEFSINHSNDIGEFHYDISANFSWSRTKYGHTEQKPFTSGYDKWRNEYKGNWTNSSWGYGTDGRFTDPQEIINSYYLVGHSKKEQFVGDVKYKDWNGDGYIDDKDRHIIGRGDYPEQIFGITINMSYKGFELMTFWQGAGKSEYTLFGSSTNPFKMDTPDKGTFEYLNNYYHKADYTKPNGEWIPGKYPAYRNGYSAINAYGGDNTFWRKSGSYLRLKNVELGYTLPNKLTNKVGLKSTRFYVNASNVFTIRSFKHIDPETPGGQDISDYPQVRILNAGVNLKF